jgi:hypothetical protein
MDESRQPTANEGAGSEANFPVPNVNICQCFDCDNTLPEKMDNQPAEWHHRYLITKFCSNCIEIIPIP